MQTEQKRPVGVLGAGRMGLPIIGHLVAGGFPVVVYDVDPAKRDTVAARGAAFVTDIGEVAARHRLLFKPDEPAIALVTMNQLVLDSSLAAVHREIRATIAEFHASIPNFRAAAEPG